MNPARLTKHFHRFLVGTILLLGFFSAVAPCYATDFEWVEVDEKDPHDFVLELSFEIKDSYNGTGKHFFKKKVIVVTDNPDGTSSFEGAGSRASMSCSIGCGPSGSTTTSVSSSILALNKGLQVDMSVRKSGLKNDSYKKTVLIPWNQTDFSLEEAPWKIQAKIVWLQDKTSIK